MNPVAIPFNWIANSKTVVIIAINDLPYRHFLMYHWAIDGHVPSLVPVRSYQELFNDSNISRLWVKAEVVIWLCNGQRYVRVGSFNL